ncbi:hypothetical protein AMECASPLE_034392 [Ameca splendens]|uniref:Uncharacterized protein n=1 Tax=Ameca splendens TaxID=208324 RepID=A0ABV0XK24_9TELE
MTFEILPDCKNYCQRQEQLMEQGRRMRAANLRRQCDLCALTHSMLEAALLSKTWRISWVGSSPVHIHTRSELHHLEADRDHLKSGSQSSCLVRTRVRMSVFSPGVKQTLVCVKQAKRGRCEYTLKTS